MTEILPQPSDNFLAPQNPGFTEHCPQIVSCKPLALLALNTPRFRQDVSPHVHDPDLSSAGLSATNIGHRALVVQSQAKRVGEARSCIEESLNFVSAKFIRGRSNLCCILPCIVVSCCKMFVTDKIVEISVTCCKTTGWSRDVPYIVEAFFPIIFAESPFGLC